MLPSLYLCPLEDGARFQILIVTWVLDVGLDPTDVLTPTEAPLLETLQTDDHVKHRLMTSHILHMTMSAITLKKSVSDYSYFLM